MFSLFLYMSILLYAFNSLRYYFGKKGDKCSVGPRDSAVISLP